MANAKPITVVCSYRVKAGKERQFRKLLDRHWPTLKRLGPVASPPRLIGRGIDKHNRGDFVEVFAWKDEKAVRSAHTFPDLMSIWEPMEALCEARGGRPAMEFPAFEQLV